jgi:hypothetical protein
MVTMTAASMAKVCFAHKRGTVVYLSALLMDHVVYLLCKRRPIDNLNLAASCFAVPRQLLTTFQVAFRHYQ